MAYWRVPMAYSTASVQPRHRRTPARRVRVSHLEGVATRPRGPSRERNIAGFLFVVNIFCETTPSLGLSTVGTGATR